MRKNEYMVDSWCREKAQGATAAGGRDRVAKTNHEITCTIGQSARLDVEALQITNLDCRHRSMKFVLIRNSADAHPSPSLPADF